MSCWRSAQAFELRRVHNTAPAESRPHWRPAHIPAPFRPSPSHRGGARPAPAPGAAISRHLHIVDRNEARPAGLFRAVTSQKPACETQCRFRLTPGQGPLRICCRPDHWRALARLKTGTIFRRNVSSTDPCGNSRRRSRPQVPDCRGTVPLPRGGTACGAGGPDICADTRPHRRARFRGA